MAASFASNKCNSGNVAKSQTPRSIRTCLPTLDFEVDTKYCAMKMLITLGGNLNECPLNLLPRLQHLRARVTKEADGGLDLFNGKIALSVNPTVLRHQYAQMTQAFKTLVRCPDFQKWINETRASVGLLKDEWTKHAPLYAQTFSSITKLDLSGMNYKVKVLHPALPAGASVNEGDIIEWRYVGEHFPEYLRFNVHTSYFMHFNATFLLHEVLHHKNLLGVSHNHAIIQLATDNEMRKRLAHLDYPPFEGHKCDIPVMAKIYDEWQDFLKGKNGTTILDFAKRVERTMTSAPPGKL